MGSSKTKLIQEKKFEEFELVNSNGEKQYAGISERDVTARELQITDKTGKQVNVWKVYSNNTHIATIDVNGKIKLTDEYKEILKSEKSIDKDGNTVVGERWLQAMVPLNDRFSGKDIDDMQERKAMQRINMEQRIKEETEKEQERISRKSGSSKTDATKEQNKGPITKQQVPKPQKIEKDLGLQSGDIEACTVIKDKRFYENVPEARVANGLSVLAYSKSKKEFFVIAIDDAGVCTKLQTIETSELTTDTTTHVKDGIAKEEAVQNIMNVKGNDELAYSVRINPGSSELDFYELHRDLAQAGDMNPNKYVSTELETSTQRPSVEEVKNFRKDENPEISDEATIIEEYKQAGVEVTRVESVTREQRAANGILTISQVEKLIQDKPEEVQEYVREGLKNKEAHKITRDLIEKMIRERQQELENSKYEKTPWGDVEARALRTK